MARGQLCWLRSLIASCRAARTFSSSGPIAASTAGVNSMVSASPVAARSRSLKKTNPRAALVLGVGSGAPLAELAAAAAGASLPGCGITGTREISQHGARGGQLELVESGEF